ncbi:MAG: 2-C-methyl-D-erythritol 4-phosphate cytidylyltransferase [Roseburia sp.]|nr:2-C-methyl-D-erythritol 4-phosphate cytidylyltransferase [Roseburia sp.]
MNIALILSGGTGARLGAGIPKQYIEIGGRPIISYCIETLSECAGIDFIWIAADKRWHKLIIRGMEQSPAALAKFKGFTVPGENRQLSIVNGLEEIGRDASAEDYVLIHDAARPLVSGRQIEAVLRGAAGYDGAIPVLPVKDTLYASEDGRRISALLKRREIFAGQAPEAFVLGKYHEANRRLTREELLEINGSTEPAVIAGMKIRMLAGDERNFKLTTMEDLERFRGIAEKRAE